MATRGISGTVLGGRVFVRQSPGNGGIDTEDRIQLSLRLVAALVAAGL